MQYSPPSHVNCSHGSSVIDNIDEIKIGKEMSEMINDCFILFNGDGYIFSPVTLAERAISRSV